MLSYFYFLHGVYQSIFIFKCTHFSVGKEDASKGYRTWLTNCLMLLYHSCLWLFLPNMLSVILFTSKQLYIFLRMLLDLPSLLFYSTYTLLVLFWAEIYYWLCIKFYSFLAIILVHCSVETLDIECNDTNVIPPDMKDTFVST